MEAAVRVHEIAHVLLDLRRVGLHPADNDRDLMVPTLDQHHAEDALDPVPWLKDSMQ